MSAPIARWLVSFSSSFSEMVFFSILPVCKLTSSREDGEKRSWQHEPTNRNQTKCIFIFEMLVTFQIQFLSLNLVYLRLFFYHRVWLLNESHIISLLKCNLKRNVKGSTIFIGYFSLEHSMQSRHWKCMHGAIAWRNKGCWRKDVSLDTVWSIPSRANSFELREDNSKEKPIEGSSQTYIHKTTDLPSLRQGVTKLI